MLGSYRSIYITQSLLDILFNCRIYRELHLLPQRRVIVESLRRKTFNSFVTTHPMELMQNTAKCTCVSCLLG